MKNVVIAGYARSPFQPARKGELAKVRPDDLAAQVVRQLVARTGVPTEKIEDLILGGNALRLLKVECNTWLAGSG